MHLHVVKELDAIAYTCKMYVMTMTAKKREERGVLAWARMIRVSQALMAAVEHDLKAADVLPLAWYDALLELARAAPKGLRPFELQEEMLLAQYNISRLVDRLARENLIEKAPCPEDGRGFVLHISESGRRALKETWVVYRNAIHSHFLDKLSDDEISDLLRVLDRLKTTS